MLTRSPTWTSVVDSTASPGRLTSRTRASRISMPFTLMRTAMGSGTRLPDRRSGLEPGRFAMGGWLFSLLKRPMTHLSFKETENARRKGFYDLPAVAANDHAPG